jgi:cysteine desulfurase / selenocysteine lyase
MTTIKSKQPQQQPDSSSTGVNTGAHASVGVSTNINANSFNPYEIRRLFPLLNQQVHEKPLVYLDNAATTQKPLAVINALCDYYMHENSNIGRSVYALAERATTHYNNVREKTRAFLNAHESCEIIFTPNSTFAVNLVASSLGKLLIGPRDRILVSTMEHHSNFVPWQMLCEEKGAHLDVIPITDDGIIDMYAYDQLLTPQTKIIAISHVSNVLGTINPIKKMIAMARAHGIKAVLVDGAQAIPHLAIDVQDLDCDFYVFSGHKIYAPTGSGALYGKKTWLEKMPPYQSGGGMIKSVSTTKTTFADLPEKFEAGTPDIGGVIGLGAALDFVKSVGIHNIAQHEKKLLDYATAQLKNIPNLKIIGEAPDKASVISFVFPDMHPHDIATILDTDGIAVRAGHHCAMPLVVERFHLPATTRLSLAMYTIKEEIDALVKGLLKAREILA